MAGSRPIPAYVLNEDAVGRRFRLFPLEGLALENPLRAKVQHRLPGSLRPETSDTEDDASRYWEVSSEGGQETLMLIASTRPLDDLERQIEEISPAVETPEVEVDTFRGIGGLSPAPSERPRLSLEELRTELEESYGGEIQIWQIQLTNPSPPNDD